MKTISILLLYISLFTSQSKVYICNSPNAKKYHYNENCRGLNSCKHEIQKVTIKEAQSLGLTLCGWED